MGGCGRCSSGVAFACEAYCRAVTASPPAGYDPSAKGCFGFAGDGGASTGLFPLFWRNECVSYSLQSSASKYVPLSDAKRIVAQAFQAWSTAACPGGPPSITAVPFPEVDCNDVPSAEHGNVIIFRDTIWPYDDAANAVGYTTLTVDLLSGEILGADTEINSGRVDNRAGASGADELGLRFRDDHDPRGRTLPRPRSQLGHRRGDVREVSRRHGAPGRRRRRDLFGLPP